MKCRLAMTGFLCSSFIMIVDLRFDHVIHTLSDAKFYGKTDGVDCRAIQASVLKLWIII